MPGLLILAGTIIYAFHKADSSEDTIYVQGLCFLVALIWTLYLGRHMLLTTLPAQLRSLRIHPAWLVVLIAIILRYLASSLMPPVNQTGFEELQTGSIAYRILWTHELPIEFRFTNLLGFLDLALA